MGCIFSNLIRRAQLKLKPQVPEHPFETIVKILPELPFVIIVEILSWMPANSLIKFKYVCKEWCRLIQDYKFIAKHLDRATTPLNLSVQFKCGSSGLHDMVLDGNFKYISDCAGLLLEQSRGSPQVFRIRNPAMNQVLYLPDAHHGTSLMNFALNSITGEWKAACFYSNHEMKNGFEVITVGYDEQWRLKTPKKNNKTIKNGKSAWVKTEMVRLDKIKGFAHFADISTDGQEYYLDVNSFDVWSECFVTNTLPRGVFVDLREVFLLRWNHSVAVAEVMEEVLTVLVLEDFKQHKWSKNKITVTLKFLADKPHLKGQICPGIAGSDNVKLQNAVEYISFYELRNRSKYVLSCNMEGEIVKEATTKKTDGTKYILALDKPSLITIKGMKPETGLSQE